MKYTVIYERSPTGYGAYVPDLPGLGVIGATLEETKRLIREGIKAHISFMREHGDVIPEPTSVADEVEVALSA